MWCTMSRVWDKKYPYRNQILLEKYGQDSGGGECQNSFDKSSKKICIFKC